MENVVIASLGNLPLARNDGRQWTRLSLRSERQPVADPPFLKS
jgi:hypothetical protein